LLIPAYNEQERIGPVLEQYCSYFQKNYPGKFELVVVLNGCRDDTLGVVMAAAEKFPLIHALEFAAPIGKGGALIEGLKLAPLADLIGYVDADGATAPPAFHDLVRHADRADCVIASRWMKESVLHQAQANDRRFASRVFHGIVQGLFPRYLGKIKDTQCGAKVMHREAVERIHPSLRIADMAFDINLLYVLRREGFSILEIPTEWTDQMGSKVVLGRTSLTMLLSVIRLRLIYSPLHRVLRFFRPVEAWIYKKLRAPLPLSRTEEDRKRRPE
jgi:glycosyltransferase involved in cell wall biosynthesis